MRLYYAPSRFCSVSGDHAEKLDFCTHPAVPGVPTLTHLGGIGGELVGI